ncbi:MAG: hypothetical protein L6R42_004008 [Xanthoria sp. 1 TBL-2021]|nr:MAG: hypothetical protein L6R42_004008 [Xanthoria sp. 1 TBL-2021]
MSTSTGPGWAQLRQQTRALEAQTDALFHTYSRFASAPNIPPKPTEEEKNTESQIQVLLEKREFLIEELTRLLTSTSPLTSSALKQNNLTLHRSTLQEHTSTLTRLRTSISDARQRANLLSTVRSDISAYHSSNPETAEADYMLDERSRIDRSHGVADSVLSQAYAVNEQFGVQREMLGNVQRRIVGAAGKVPGINGLIGRIGAKKRRDGFVMAGFVAFCMLMFLYFM